MVETVVLAAAVLHDALQLGAHCGVANHHRDQILLLGAHLGITRKKYVHHKKNRLDLQRVLHCYWARPPAQLHIDLVGVLHAIISVWPPLAII